jgi:hypothetical protein
MSYGDNREKKVNATELHDISQRTKTDKEYTKRMITEFSFAKSELSRAGVTISPEMHKEIQDAYEKFTNSITRAAQESLPLEHQQKAKVDVTACNSYGSLPRGPPGIHFSVLQIEETGEHFLKFSIS